MNKIAKAIPFNEATTFDNFITTMWDYVKDDFTHDVVIDKYTIGEEEVNCVSYTYVKTTKKTSKSCVVRFIDDIGPHEHAPRNCSYTYTYDLILVTKDITQETSRDVFASFYKQFIEDVLTFPNWNIGKDFEKLISSKQDVEVRLSNITESLDASGNAKLTADYCTVFVTKE